MWSKVNNWLHDFDKKTNLIIGDIEKQPTVAQDQSYLEQSLEGESLLMNTKGVVKDFGKFSMFDIVADDKENQGRFNGI